MQAIRTAREQALSLALFALLPLAAVSTEGQLQAQARTKFLLHYYADSIYGDNAHAWALNPTRNRFLAPHQNAPALILGLLQHAPYSFQTLTGTQGAVAHIRAQFPTLPYTLKNGNIVTGVVIHCAPGLYGPRKPGLTQEIDPSSGLPWNGESFPVDLPNRVSIQGTSALDTIFDGRGEEGFVSHIFKAFKPMLGVPIGEGSHKKSFIAHVTIRGAALSEGSGPPNGAGIFIDGSDGPVDLLVHNCFITENVVGIAMTYSSAEETTPSSPAIVNNTIAWNTIGIWSGLSNFGAKNHTGQSLPRVHNNLIDPFHPADPTGGANSSAFEGLHRDDLEVGISPGGAAPYRTFNAWEGPAIPISLPYGWANFLGTASSGWPVTGPRGAPIPGTVQGLVDITPITFGKASTPIGRGTLFVNDLFRNHGGSDLSPHDFRLSVYTPPNTSIGILVNTGAVPSSFGGSLVFRNFRTITISNGWGLTTGTGDAYDLEFAQMNVAAWDAEGFGNTRSYLRQNWPGGQYSNMDLGADELGDLIMAGFIFRTRIFSLNVPNAPGVSSHNLIYFVDSPNITGTQTLRPLANAIFGQSWYLGPNWIDNRWWLQAQNNSNPPAPPWASSNYTDGVWGSIRYSSDLNPYRSSFMRNLECDFSPHLLLDINPMWPTMLEVNYARGYPIGIYSSNPWFDGTTIPNFPAIFPDNPFLYYNPNGGGFPIPSATYVQAGILNSPGTYLNAAGGGDYLDLLWPPSLFVATGGGVPANRNYYNTNSFGLGDSIAIDTIINTYGLGMRVNCQVKYPGPPVTWSNLQTHLQIYVDSQQTKESTKKAPRLTRKQKKEMLKKLMKRLKRKPQR